MRRPETMTVTLGQRIAEAERRQGERTGDPIAGSKLLRAYCASCFEPIRVTTVRVRNYCAHCNPAVRPMEVRR
ncbi:MAG: hypothetical protein ACREJC_19210 [Tepidisphaeraceae bacterium]